MMRLLVILVVIGSLAWAEAPATKTTQSLAGGFGWVDVYLDSHGKSLAAYQLELMIADQAATVVGIEGGETMAFKEPPYYDPAAMSQSRVILAAYSIGTDLPTARVRVARVHLQFRSPDRKYTANIITAGTADGAKIDAEASVSEGAQP